MNVRTSSHRGRGQLDPGRGGRTTSGRELPAPSVRRFEAFTLLEVMIAIAIFAVVVTAMYSSWTAILRGSKVGLDVAAEAQRTRIALRALEESLAAAQFFPENMRYYSFETDTTADFAILSFVSKLSSSFPGSGLFHGQTVRRVTFAVGPGEDRSSQLLLHQNGLLEPPEAAEEPYTIVLAHNVTLFQLEFLDPQTFEWLPEWTLTNQLPRLVKCSLAFGPPDRRPLPEEVISRVIQIGADSGVPGRRQ
jgi:prepilin-type N-terminal cleavage/methylation domain-containing protein